MFQNCGLRAAIKIALSVEEVTYGVDPGSGYTSWLLNSGGEITPEAEKVERTIQTSTYSPQGSLTGSLSHTGTLPVELIGGGVDQNSKVVAPYYKDGLTAGGFVEFTGYVLGCTGSTGTWVTKETVTQASTKAIHLGTANLSAGHDWSGTSEKFSINVNNGGATEVTLTANCANVGAVVSEINAALATAVVTGVEAYASGNYVGIRTTTAGSNQSFILATASPSALTTLGWTAATYTGTAAITGILRDVRTGVGGAVSLRLTSSSTFTAGATVTGAGGATATIATATDAIYYLLTSRCEEMSSMTVHFIRDALLHVATGVRTDPSITIESGKIGTLSFGFTGLYTDPTNISPPSATVPETLPPLAMGVGVVFGDLASELLSCPKFDVKPTNTISKHPDMTDPNGMSSVTISGRKPTGTITLMAPTSLTDFNPIAIARAGTRVRIELLLGTQHGNKMLISIPYAQIDMPKFGEAEGQVTYEITFTPTGPEGDDELYLAYL